MTPQFALLLLALLCGRHRHARSTPLQDALLTRRTAADEGESGGPSLEQHHGGIRANLFDSIEDTYACNSQQATRMQGRGYLSLISGRAIDDTCQAQVLPKYVGADSKVEVLDVKRVHLDCEALHLRASMAQLRFEVRGREFVAARNSFEFFPDAGGRNVWTGELIGTVGAVTVVWDEDCSADVFHMLVTLPDGRDRTNNVLRTLPCKDTRPDALGRPLPRSSPHCAWLTQLRSEPRQELEGSEEKRRALSEQVTVLAQDPQVAAVDADIELLRRVRAGNASAVAEFGRGGGRHLTAERQVLMPSGRRLDDGSVVRVLFLYTAASASRWGTETLKSMIVASVASANQVLSNSGLSFTIELAGLSGADYVENGSMETALDAVSTGKITGVADLRDSAKADLVQLIVDDRAFCGYGNILDRRSTGFAPFAYSVIYSGCYSVYSHIHEMGHNMGAQHDGADIDAGQLKLLTWPYGKGWRWCAGVDSEPWFRSIMSYSCDGATRVPYFSSPTLTYSGRATGTADADNRRVLADNALTVANFR